MVRKVISGEAALKKTWDLAERFWLAKGDFP